MILTDLSKEPVRAITKQQQTKSKRVKRTQRQRGYISPKARQQVRARSKGICEVKVRCNGDRAVQQAHLKGRRLIDETTPEMLLDACLACHLWLDTTPEGIRYKRQLRSENG